MVEKMPYCKSGYTNHAVSTSELATVESITENLEYLSPPYGPSTHVDDGWKDSGSAAEIIRNVCHPPPGPSLREICDIFRKTNFTDATSLSKLIKLACTSRLSEIPVGCHYMEIYNLCLSDSLASADTGTSLPKATNPLAFYLDRVDILDQNGNPDPRLRLIFTLGQLIKADAPPELAQSGFYLVVNPVDSSVWILYEFDPLSYMGQSYAIGDDDTWGELAAGEARFSAAKIANTINESGIGQADSPIYFDPKDTIRGGPGKVKLCSPDDRFLRTHLPRKHEPTVPIPFAVVS